MKRYMRNTIAALVSASFIFGCSACSVVKRIGLESKIEKMLEEKYPEYDFEYHSTGESGFRSYTVSGYDRLVETSYNSETGRLRDSFLWIKYEDQIFEDVGKIADTIAYGDYFFSSVGNTGYCIDGNITRSPHGMGMGNYPFNEYEMDYETFISYDLSFISIKIGIVVDSIDNIDVEDYQTRINDAFSQSGFVTSLFSLEITDDPDELIKIRNNETNTFWSDRVVDVTTSNDHTDGFTEFDWKLTYNYEGAGYDIVSFPVEEEE